MCIAASILNWNVTNILEVLMQTWLSLLSSFLSLIVVKCTLHLLLTGTELEVGRGVYHINTHIILQDIEYSVTHDIVYIHLPASYPGLPRDKGEGLDTRLEAPIVNYRYLLSLNRLITRFYLTFCHSCN